MSVRASVIIRSKDEADRLRLTLTSLACQSEPPEVVVVNDGSSDHTRDVIAKAEGVNIVALHSATPAGDLPPPMPEPRRPAATSCCSSTPDSARSHGAEYFYPPQNHVSRIWIWRGFE